MRSVRLGRTGLEVSATSFGALPIQRVDFATADRLLNRALDAGITLIDTARAYSDSEEKIGRAVSARRDAFVLATKSAALTREGLLQDLETSLTLLKTDHVDVLQLHNPNELPDADDPDSAYGGLLHARTEGKVRFIGITSHRRTNAVSAAESGLYDTLQFPLSAISSDEDMALAGLCRQHDIGLIAMKGLCGGLLTDIAAAFAFFLQFDNVVPIWGIQRDEELEEFLALERQPPLLHAEMRVRIQSEREELSGAFCRGCGYCLPCPADIPIPMAARMKYLLRRAPTERFFSEDWQAQMRRIEQCQDCGQCRERCPYDLDTPALLRDMLEDYEMMLAQAG